MLAQLSAKQLPDTCLLSVLLAVPKSGQNSPHHAGKTQQALWCQLYTPCKLPDTIRFWHRCQARLSVKEARLATATHVQVQCDEGCGGMKSCLIVPCLSGSSRSTLVSKYSCQDFSSTFTPCAELAVGNSAAPASSRGALSGMVPGIRPECFSTMYMLQKLDM